jgi:transposase
MHEIQSILTERVDDLPLLLEQRQRMNLPTLIDRHFPTHGNWQGLSLGWVSTIWLSSILSRGAHRLVHGEAWGANRLWTLRTATGQAVERLDFTDDRLEIVLRRWRDDTRWAQCESTRNQHTVRVYAPPTERRHVDSTSASTYARVTDEGLLQFGPSNAHRPALPQVKVMQAVLDPLGLPLATAVVSGERADDPLSMPCIKRVQASLGRTGRLLVGDGKMAARARRAFIASKGDDYLCPLPQVHLADGEWAEACEAIWSGEQVLLPIFREREDGAPDLIAQGYERHLPMDLEVDGKPQRWPERRWVGRSVRHAKAAEGALRARVAKAKAQVEALHQRGRGRKRFEEVAALRQAAHEIVQRQGVEDCLWLRYEQHGTPRRVRAYRDRLAQVTDDRHATVEVRVDEEALAATGRRLGWRR